jgi:hypothetical protein
MDITFISGLLFISLSFLIILYLYQNMHNNETKKSKNNTDINLKKDAFLPLIYDSCKIQRINSMPVHHVGPIYNFHQHFNSSSKNNKGAYPTGIPELGWRNWYLSNNNNNNNCHILSDDPFAGTVFRNFLNNMDSLDNIYRKC